jgi:hypothetical protein
VKQLDSPEYVYEMIWFEQNTLNFDFGAVTYRRVGIVYCRDHVVVADRSTALLLAVPNGIRTRVYFHQPSSQ